MGLVNLLVLGLGTGLIVNWLTAGLFPGGIVGAVVGGAAGALLGGGLFALLVGEGAGASGLSLLAGVVGAVALLGALHVARYGSVRAG